MVGLAVFCNRQDILDRYIEIIHSDPEAASINIGYHLAYYGDQQPDMDFYDLGGEKCDGTIRSIFRRLKDEQYRVGWPLDLLTLRTLLQQRGRAILNIDEQYLPFLKTFISREHLEESKTFHKERQLLLDILEGV